MSNFSCFLGLWFQLAFYSLPAMRDLKGHLVHFGFGESCKGSSKADITIEER